MNAATMNSEVEMDFKAMQFGNLTLNRDTVCQMGAELPGLRQDRTAIDNCPKSTTTKVTAHCC